MPATSDSLTKDQRYYRNHTAERKAASARVRMEQRDAIRARKAVRRAVLSRRLPAANTLMCADCEERAAVYHHDDYTQRLAVVALCRSCHARRHRGVEGIS